MTEEDFKRRTRDFSLNVIRFVADLERDAVTAHMGRQVLRSGTSVGANYRAACRARSDAEMAAKLGIVVEEADETLFWLDLLEASNRGAPGLKEIEREAGEILKMTVTSVKTLQTKPKRRRSGVSNQQSTIDNQQSL